MIGVIEGLAFTFDFIGKVLIAVTALLVHQKVVREKKIDGKVLKYIHKEEVYGLLGIIFLIAGYVLHLISF